VLFVLSFATIGAALQAQPESVLHLESSFRSKPPFNQGEQLEVQSNPSVTPVVMRIKVVDISHWPWVLADSESGKTWLNFDHVIMVKTMATAK
jgi:hypothetical protein